jgi:hypothetical protein
MGTHLPSLTASTDQETADDGDLEEPFLAQEERRMPAVVEEVSESEHVDVRDVVGADHKTPAGREVLSAAPFVARDTDNHRTNERRKAPV